MLSFANVQTCLFMHGCINQSEVGSTVSNFQNGRCREPWGRLSATQTKIFPTFEQYGIQAKYCYNNSLGDTFTCCNEFNNGLEIQHRNLSIAIVPIYLRLAYVNLIATGIVFNIRPFRSHIGLMMAFSEHRR